MSSVLRFLYSLFFIVLVCSANAQRLDHVLGEAIIEVQQGKSGYHIAEDLQSIHSYPGGIDAEQIMTQPLNIWVLRVNPFEYNEDLFRNQLFTHSDVLSCQKNHITQLRAVPNDPLFTSQWQYINTGVNGGVADADLDMDQAWDITTGGLTVDGDTIVVCIIDDGCNTAHPDLVANLWVNHSEIPDNGLDDDNNGYIDDYRGWNAYNSSDDLSNNKHGTSVTGIVGAVGNNSLGVAGVNWAVKTMIVEGGSPESTAIAAYGYAYNQRKRYNETNGAEGAFVVATNSSWGVNDGQAEDAPIWCGFYDVMGEVGILSAGATANRSVNVDTDGDLPTTCPSDFLIAVTNLERNDSKRITAGYGVLNIDLGAYGEEAFTVNRDDYSDFGGTSGATPHVAGVIALAYSTDCQEFMNQVKSNPSVAARAVKDHVMLGVSENNSLQGITVTDGRLNAHTTLLNTISICEQTCSEAYGVHMAEIGIFEASAAYLAASNTGQTTIRYRREGTTAWREVVTDNGLATLANLTDCAVYEYQSATVCNGMSSGFSFSKYFTTAGCCEAPSSVDIVVEGSVATITWNSITGANTYNTDYRQIGDEEWIPITSGTAAQRIITGIRSCVGYEVRLQSICDIVNRESDVTVRQFFGPCGTCTEAYCDLSAKNTADEWIEVVAIDDVFENLSGDDDGAGLFYGSFEINLTIGETYTLRMAPGYSAGGFSEYFSAYIDFDQDVAFSDEETIYDVNIGTSMEVSGEFTIPSDAALGTTRMRILMRFGENNGQPCDDEDWVFGEYEEYCVTIVENQDCPTTIDAVTNIDSTINSLYFSMPAFFDTYEVTYQVQGTTDATTLISNSRNVELTDLAICTTYELSIKGICEDGTMVESAETFLLKTKCSTATKDLGSARIVLYPNPSVDLLHLYVEEPLDIRRVDILSHTGQQVYSKQIVDAQNLIVIDDADNLLAGAYLVVVYTNTSSYTQKWIKL